MIFNKIHEDAVLPTKREEDAGYDLYAAFDELCIIIEPGETKLIKTGLRSCMPISQCAIIKERSSLGSKGYHIPAGVIDSGYRGEWRVPITNTTNRLFVLKNTYHPQLSTELEMLVNEDYGDMDIFMYMNTQAIAQFLMVDVPDYGILEVPTTEFENNCMDSERGTGGFGSSGK